MDLLADLRTLMSEREQHVVAIALIDEQLSKARRALGVPTEAVAHVSGLPERKRYRSTSTAQAAILTTLATDKVMGASDLSKATGFELLHLQAALTQLRTKNLVIREKGISSAAGRWGYLYALPGTVFSEHRSVLATDEEAAEAVAAESG